MYRINNKYIIILLFGILCCITIFIFYFSSNKNYLSTQENKMKDIHRVLNIKTQEIFTNRSILVKEGTGISLEVLIGNNKKELENNFYDIKTSISLEKENPKIILKINKLWKEFINTDVQRLYNEDYLKELNLYIKDVLQCSDNDIEEISKIILKNYLLIKQYETFKVSKICINDYNIVFDKKDNELYMLINI